MCRSSGCSQGHLQGLQVLKPEGPLGMSCLSLRCLIGAGQGAEPGGSEVGYQEGCPSLRAWRGGQCGACGTPMFLNWLRGAWFRKQTLRLRALPRMEWLPLM